MDPWSILAPTAIRPLPTTVWKNSYIYQGEVAHRLRGSPCLISCFLRGMKPRRICPSIWLSISSTTVTCTTSSSRTKYHAVQTERRARTKHECVYQVSAWGDIGMLISNHL